MSYSLAEMFYAGVWSVLLQPSVMESSTEFLLRPRKYHFCWWYRGRSNSPDWEECFRLLLLLVYGVMASEIIWNPTRILTIVLMIGGGTVHFLAVCLWSMPAYAFLLWKVWNSWTSLRDGAREYGKYPLSVYGEKRYSDSVPFFIPLCTISILSFFYIW